jgi:RNA polymerase sigma-70 factor (ECF subfamily)
MCIMDQASLLAGCRAGDEAALEALVYEYHPRLFKIAVSILDNGKGDGQAEAEEAAQDALLKAVRSLDTYRGEAALSTWLIAITVNVCRNRLRARRRRDRIRRIYRGLAALGEAPGVEAVVTRHETHADLRRAVDALDDKYRIPIVLRYYHACAVAEIAQVLDIPEGTVHSRLNYARTRLRYSLKNELIEGYDDD